MFTPRQAWLNGLSVKPEDIFRESARLLDFLLNKPGINQQQVDSLWNLLIIDVSKWGTNITDRDKWMVASTVFMVVRATLTQYYDTCFSETVCDLLNQTLEHVVASFDKQELDEFHQRLAYQTPELSEWINSYDEADEWLSDQIASTTTVKSGKADEDNFVPSGQTFTKTALLTDTLIDIMGQRLARANKINANPDDLRKLFSGIDQQFTMTWMGTGGELRDLFKMLTDTKCQFARPQRGYQKILKSHFLSADGHRFTNLHGDKSIESFQPIIDDCAFLLQHLTDSMTAIMKQLVRENEDALREAGYFDHVQVQTAKQAGMSIRSKRR